MADTRSPAETVRAWTAPRVTFPSYRAVWWSVVVVVLVPSVAMGALLSPVSALVILMTTTAVVLALPLLGDGLGLSGWSSVMVAAAMFAIAAPVLGGSALLLAAGTVATSPPLVRRLRVALGVQPRRRPGSRDRATSQTGVGVGPCFEAMSGQELCQLWSRSYLLVKSPVSRSRRVLGAGLRLSLLDELERRDGAGLARWLEERPGPASEPRWILDRAPRDPPG